MPRARPAAEVPGVAPIRTLAQLRAAENACRRCPLYRDATRAVPGEGARRARVMLVGEQPGDQEDLAGKPFVGPAGRMLDKALAEAGIDRKLAFVTNAVKHFKHEERGRRRLHKRPNAYEIEQCRWWLEIERRIVAPEAVVALGATAVRSVFGRTLAIARTRGRRLRLDDGTAGFVTVHPSFLLRLPDAESRQRAYRAFVADLRLVARMLRGSTA